MSNDDGFGMSGDPWAAPASSASTSNDPWAPPVVDPFGLPTPAAVKPSPPAAAASKPTAAQQSSSKAVTAAAPVQTQKPSATPSKWDAFSGLMGSPSETTPATKKADPFEFLGGLTSSSKKKNSEKPVGGNSDGGKAPKMDMFTAMLFPDPPPAKSKPSSASKPTPKPVDSVENHAKPTPVVVAPAVVHSGAATIEVSTATVAPGADDGFNMTAPSAVSEAHATQSAAAVSTHVEPSPSVDFNEPVQQTDYDDGFQSSAAIRLWDAVPEEDEPDALVEPADVLVQPVHAEAISEHESDDRSVSPDPIDETALELDAGLSPDCAGNTDTAASLVTEEPLEDEPVTPAEPTYPVESSDAVFPGYLSQLDVSVGQSVSPIRGQGHAVTLCDTPTVIKDSHASLDDAEDRIGMSGPEDLMATSLPDDVAVIAALSTWLTNEADVVPSVANQYAVTLISHGVGTYRRLATKIERDERYLTVTLGFEQDDAHDIMAALKRFGRLNNCPLKPLVDISVADGAGSSSPSSTPEISAGSTSPELHKIPLSRASSAPSHSPKSPLLRQSSHKSKGDRSGASPAALVKARESTGSSSGDFTGAMQKRSKEEMEQLKKVSKIAQAEFQDLKNAVDSKDVYTGLASIENVSNLLQSRTQGGDAQLILGHLGVCSLVIKALILFMDNAMFVQKALPAVCFLCARGREKSMISADNLLALGLAGASKVVVDILAKYRTNELIVTWACSFVRHLATLHSNKSRLGAAGACDAVIRVLNDNRNMESVPKYAFRAIGHLANDHDRNRQLFINSGFCRSLSSIVRREINNLPSVVEGCWAIRKLAVSPQALGDMIASQFAEMLNELLTKYQDDEVVSVEVLRVVVVVTDTLVSNQVLIPREILSTDHPTASTAAARRASVTFGFGAKSNTPSTGLTSSGSNLGSSTSRPAEHLYLSRLQMLLLKPLTKAMSKKGKSVKALLLLQWCCRVVVAMARVEENNRRFAENRVCDLIVHLLHEHDDALLTEWCCKAVVAMNALEGVNSRFRSIGGCELVVIALQRLNKVPEVVEATAVAIASLATDSQSGQKLGETGACEAVVIALSRYAYSPAVSAKLLEAIHSLAIQPNNRAWFGASGACELVVKATRAHLDKEGVARSGCRAFGSLSMGHPKNIQRLRNAHAAESTIAALTTHGSTQMAMDAFRAIAAFGIGCELFGACGACEAVVSTLNKHAGATDVISGACLAIGALVGTDQNICKSNATKLIAAGANESVVDCLTRHNGDAKACVAVSAALAQLAVGTEENRAVMGSLGACEVIAATLKTHAANPAVVIAIAVAIEKISRRNIENKRKLGNSGVCELLIPSIETHSTNEVLIATVYKALVSLFYFTGNRTRSSTPEFCRVLTRPIRRQKNNRDIAANGAMALTTLIFDNSTANLFGLCKAPEAVMKAMARHMGDAEVCEWGCYALWKLTTLDSNKQVLSTVECCELIVGILKLHRDQAKVNEWGIKLLVHLATYDNTSKSSSADGPDVVGVSDSFHGKVGPRGMPSSTSAMSLSASSGADAFISGMMMKAHRRGSSAGTSLASSKNPNGGFGSADVSGIGGGSNDLFSGPKNWDSNVSKFIGCGAVDVLVASVRQFVSYPNVATVGIEALYQLGMSDDETATSALTSAGAAALITLILNKYSPANVGFKPEHFERSGPLLLQTVRLAIALMKGKTVVSYANAKNFHKAGICGALAQILKLCSSNSTHISWVCSCTSMLCQRESDSQDTFFSQTDICSTLGSQSFWESTSNAGVTDASAVLSILKTLRSLCYSNEEIRRQFCSLGVSDLAVPVAIRCSDGKEGPTVLGLTCWCMARIHVPSSAFLSTAQALSIVSQTLKISDVSSKGAHSAFEAIVVLTETPHERNAVQLGVMQVCDNVMSILNKYATDIPLVEAGFLAASGLCRWCDDNKAAFQRAGMIQYIMKVMMRGTSTHNTIGTALRVLVDMISNNREILSDLTGGNALKTIAQACTPVSGIAWSDDFSETFCAFVGNLAAMGHVFQAKLAQNNFIDMLMTYSCKNLMALPVCRASMWAVSELSYRCMENSFKLGTTGACESVMSVMKLHTSAPLVELWSCAALANLTAGGGTDNINRVFAIGACGELKRLMSATIEFIQSGTDRHAVSVRSGTATDGSMLGTDVDLLKYALWAVCNMCQSQPVCDTFGSGGMPLLCVDILQLFHKTNTTVAQLALSAISGMSQSAVNRGKMCNYTKHNLVELLDDMDRHYRGCSDKASIDLKAVLSKTRERVTAAELLDKLQPFAWDVSDGAIGFALRPREERLAGVEVNDNRPASMGKAMSKRFSMTLDKLSSNNSAAGSRPASVSHSPGPFSKSSFPIEEQQHDSGSSVKRLSTVAMAVNKFKKGTGGHHGK